MIGLGQVVFAMSATNGIATTVQQAYTPRPRKEGPTVTMETDIERTMKLLEDFGVVYSIGRGLPDKNSQHLYVAEGDGPKNVGWTNYVTDFEFTLDGKFLRNGSLGLKSKGEMQNGFFSQRLSDHVLCLYGGINP